MLEQWLGVLDQDPHLAHFRAAARTGPERQLALVAALERAVVVGTPAVSPPSPDDQADLLLCDILDCIDRHPDLKRQGSYYGADRYLANLQVLGVWRGTEPLQQPTARELFTTSFSNLTSGPASVLQSTPMNNSPASQVFSANGELIGTLATAEGTAPESMSSSQTVEGVVLSSNSPNQGRDSEPADSRGIIHQPTDNGGEQIANGQSDLRLVPSRPLRRGRPIALDDLAKGRLLGLISYGLSFRQAAAQLGVHHVTILNTLKRDEEFAQQVSEARLDAISQPLLTVVHASRTNWRAAAWLAKFLEERRVRNIETTPEERAVESIRCRS